MGSVISIYSRRKLGTTEDVLTETAQRYARDPDLALAAAAELKSRSPLNDDECMNVTSQRILRWAIEESRNEPIPPRSGS